MSVVVDPTEDRHFEQVPGHTAEDLATETVAVRAES